MPTFLIERTVPGAETLSPEHLQTIAQKSCDVVRALGPELQWLHSYVTKDRLTCVYRAPDAELVREHARAGGFPADRVAEVVRVFDPETAHGALWQGPPPAGSPVTSSGR